MKVRSEILKVQTAILLSGAMAIVVGASSAALAADASPILKAPAPEQGWYSEGELEVGARAFIQRPGSGFGYGAGGNFLLPTQTDSRAKFEEYGKIPPGLFLDWFSLGAHSKDGRYSFNVWGKNVGVNSQSYGLDAAQNGFQYLTLGWDQTPHLYSTSAKTLFSGVGSTNLTVNDTVQDALQVDARTAGSTVSNAARVDINKIINNNAMSINEIGTQRDKFSAGYRITPTPDWDIKVDYSHEHRTGTKPGTLDFYYTYGTTTNFFPSNVVAVPIPVDETTQNVKSSGEYAGTSPLGKFTVKLGYGGSFYNDNLTALNVDNPFCRTCSQGVPAAGVDWGPNILRLGLPPSNSANAFTAAGSTDIPIFKSRFTTSNQWSVMKQNDAFIQSPYTALAGTAVGALPASSLNGEVRTFLTNNTLTSKFSDNVWNSLRIRYYERNNETTERTYNNVVFADSEVAAGPFTTEYTSYKKTNIDESLKWRTPIKGLMVGATYSFERWDRTNRFTGITNENTGKVFADWKLANYATWRNSYSYSARRYNGDYFIDDGSWLNGRMFDLANRNRQKAKTSLDVVVNRFVTVTPSAGLRWDDYPGDAVNQTGVSSEHSWNAGVQVAVVPTPTWRVMAGYTYERIKMNMSGAVADADYNNGAGPNTCGFPGYAFTTPYTVPGLCTWSDSVTQGYHTFTANADWKAIPGKLDFRFDYIASWSRESHDFTPCAVSNAFAYNCNGISTNVAGTTPAQVGLPWPDNTNLYQRFNVTGRYYFDQDVVQRMGLKGQLIAKLRYTYEHNHGAAWQSDTVNTYFGTLTGNADLTGTNKSIWLAYNNPNYTAQLIAASLSFKW